MAVRQVTMFAGGSWSSDRYPGGRVSAFSRQDPGYIDDVRPRKKNVNVQDVRGGAPRPSWRPNSDVSLKVAD